MKKNEDIWNRSKFQVDLEKAAKSLVEIRQALGGLWMHRDSKMEIPFSLEFRGAITKAIERMDDSMRALLDVEKIMVVAVHRSVAESLDKKVFGEEPPSEKPSELNKGENA
jgi:hypothetical protein